jgi:hypothetical protein
MCRAGCASFQIAESDRWVHTLRRGVLVRTGPNYVYAAIWSPDSKMIALVDKTMSIFLLDLEKVR